jgi:hypothetical protein
METIKMIKPDAIVDIKIGTGFLQQIQNLLMYLAKDLTTDQLAQYKKEAEEKIPFSEEWMTHITTISILLKEIEIKADEQGFAYDEEVPPMPSSSTEEGN